MKHEAFASAPVARQRPARWVSGRRARVLLCASGVSFMIMLDSNIVASALLLSGRDAHQIVARMVAGDISGAAGQTAEPFRSAFAELARASFASGFTLVLLAAGMTAALAAALTFGFVSPVETAPVRLRAVPDTGTPELVD
jgi:hypothetical protein